MATDVYRAPEMRHRVGEKHHSIWEGSGGAGMPPWKGQNGGCWMGGCLAPCPRSPSLAEGPWAASCRGRFGFVQGLLPQPCSGEVPGAWHNQPRLCQPPAQESQGWEFAVSWGSWPWHCHIPCLSKIHQLPSQSSQELTRLQLGRVSAVLPWSSAARPILAAGLLLRGA